MPSDSGDEGLEVAFVSSLESNLGNRRDGGRVDPPNQGLQVRYDDAIETC